MTIDIISIDGHSSLPDVPPAAIALGNFDGMHKGHQQVIRSASRIAANSSVPLAALTFEPHPISVLFPAQEPFRLTNIHQKATCMASLGVEFLYVVTFTPQFSQITAKDFIETILMRKLKAQHIVTGYDFIFGHKRQGDTTLLQHYALQHAFGFTSIPALTLPHDPRTAYSSTGIRQLIKHGKIQEVFPLLDRYFSLAGTVIQGNKQGRLLGFPTANLPLGDFIRPVFGVYAVQVNLEGTIYPGIANIGCRPTFGHKEPLLEVHIFDFDQMLYDRYIEVSLVEFLRDEKQFDSLQALQTQITSDCLHARQLLGIS